MTREEEILLDELNRKKEYEARCSEYLFDISSYFRILLGNVELFKNTVNGEESSLDYSPAHLKVIRIKGKFNIEEDEFNGNIYCCLFENDGYYHIYRTKDICVEYNDKCYNIDIEWESLEYNPSNYNVLCDVYECDKNIFKLSHGNIIAYNNNYHENQKIINMLHRERFELTLNYNTNIISEVISRIRKKDKTRTHKS